MPVGWRSAAAAHSTTMSRTGGCGGGAGSGGTCKREHQRPKPGASLAQAWRKPISSLRAIPTRSARPPFQTGERYQPPAPPRRPHRKRRERRERPAAGRALFQSSVPPLRSAAAADPRRGGRSEGEKLPPSFGPRRMKESSSFCEKLKCVLFVMHSAGKQGKGGARPGQDEAGAEAGPRCVSLL